MTQEMESFAFATNPYPGLEECASKHRIAAERPDRTVNGA